mgnify:CR=1 FL=1
MTTIAIIVLTIFAISAISFYVAKTAFVAIPVSSSVPSVNPISNGNSPSIPTTETPIPVAIGAVSVPEEKYNSSKMVYNAINVPTYDFPNAEILFNQKWQMFSHKDLHKFCKKLSIERIEEDEDCCFMHTSCYNKNGQWFAVHCHWFNNDSFRPALSCTVRIYYFDATSGKRESVTLFEHKINIVSYRDLRLFIDYALRVKRAYMKQTSVA